MSKCVTSREVRFEEQQPENSFQVSTEQYNFYETIISNFTCTFGSLKLEQNTTMQKRIIAQ